MILWPRHIFISHNFFSRPLENFNGECLLFTSIRSTVRSLALRVCCVCALANNKARKKNGNCILSFCWPTIFIILTSCCHRYEQFHFISLFLFYRSHNLKNSERERKKRCSPAKKSFEIFIYFAWSWSCTCTYWTKCSLFALESKLRLQLAIKWLEIVFANIKRAKQF